MTVEEPPCSSFRGEHWLSFWPFWSWDNPPLGRKSSKYSPNDTESVVTINVRQTLNSRPFKQHALEHLKRKLKNSDEVQKLLQELNFDPLGDVGSCTLCSRSDDEIKNVALIIHGKFDVAKLQAKVAKVAQDGSGIVKILDRGENKFYEITSRLVGPSFFAAIVDDKTLVITKNKEYIHEVFEKKAGMKKTTLPKEVQDLIRKIDDAQSLWFAVFSNAGPPFSMIDGFSEIGPKLDYLTGGLTLTDDANATFTMVFKDTVVAKETKERIEKLLVLPKNDKATDFQKLYRACSRKAPRSM